MEKLPETEPIVVTIALQDPVLAERIGALLAGVAGIRLASQGEGCEVRLVEGDGEVGHSCLEQPLSAREVEVLGLLAEGSSNRAIAQRLGISVHTAKFHVGQLLDKLDATGRTDAVAQAARLGVLQL